MFRYVNRLLDLADHSACRAGLRKLPSWERVLERDPVRLYAGKLRRGLPQFATYTGITPFFPSSKNIPYDVTQVPYPIPDESVDRYQSEDVFEHVPFEAQIAIYDEVYRILKPGGLFRLSVPDYNFDGYRDRSVHDEQGNLLFDPAGGGRFQDGKVVDGGHLWFPTIDLMRDLFSRCRFGQRGTVTFLHYTEADGTAVMNPIDYSMGNVQRTPDHDPRVAERPRPLSIIIDARKLR